MASLEDEGLRQSWDYLISTLEALGMDDLENFAAAQRDEILRARELLLVRQEISETEEQIETVDRYIATAANLGEFPASFTQNELTAMCQAITDYSEDLEALWMTGFYLGMMCSVKTSLSPESWAFTVKYMMSEAASKEIDPEASFRSVTIRMIERFHKHLREIRALAETLPEWDA